ncbi:hypothetical protein DUI87_32722 [Hirundo rustica rustica]|uniref:NAD(P)(+)--arginine ADP-ribosyltransferase n=1 Tax=Hirundo rustica rustica TaxID=333673 RepID=A0A3M0IWG3_HIRRU|nr:hypothetical protein DUI87_32722 [Hirundo rustica rustica]
MAPLAHTLALLAMTVATAAIDEEWMDMAPNSFDDQYRDCGPAMTAVFPALNRSEFQDNPVFAQAWLKAVAEWQRKGVPCVPSVILSPGHRCHGLLNEALVKLREDQNAQCRNVFRGVHDICFMARRGQRVRFGHFTSTSLSRKVAEDYGTDTVFQVTKVTRKGDKADIELSSTGTYSKYNCEWLEGDTTGDSLGNEDTRRGHGATHGSAEGTGLCTGRGWERPLGPLPPWRPRPGHHSTGSGHRDPLSHKATNVTVVTVATVANIITKTP